MRDRNRSVYTCKYLYIPPRKVLSLHFIHFAPPPLNLYVCCIYCCYFAKWQIIPIFIKIISGGRITANAQVSIDFCLFAWGEAEGTVQFQTLSKQQQTLFFTQFKESKCTNRLTKYQPQYFIFLEFELFFFLHSALFYYKICCFLACSFGTGKYQ